MSGSKIEITYLPLDSISEYNNNPRVNDQAVDKLVKSIQKYGFLVPIVLDKNNIILAGHTRYKASQKMGLKEVPCIIADSLSDIKGKEFRIVDNRVGEYAQWDIEKLKEEIDDIGDTSFEDDFELQLLIEDAINTDIDSPDDTTYTTKIDAPTYTPNPESKVSLEELVDKTQYEKLNKEIDSSNVPSDIKAFLKIASCRHLRFNYSAIAEYYAKADADTQDLMERSGLVIIDYNKAIEYGFTRLQSETDALLSEESEDE